MRNKVVLFILLFLYLLNIHAIFGKSGNEIEYTNNNNENIFELNCSSSCDTTIVKGVNIETGIKNYNDCVINVSNTSILGSSAVVNFIADKSVNINPSFQIEEGATVTIKAVAREEIVMNQVGFYQESRKIAAVLNCASSNDSFQIISCDNGSIVYSGKLGSRNQSANSYHNVKLADFSDLIKPGWYKIKVGNTESCKFKIGYFIYTDIGKALLKGFYYQRASMDLEEEYAGKWSRKGGHPDTIVYIHASAATKERPEGTIISSPGGWYDAGDYNKYIVNCGITMWTLFSAYQDYQDYFEELDTNIPETGNGAPDVLNESTYNLRWMLTMQDSEDGGVYHKLTNPNFVVGKMPIEAIDESRYVVKKSTGASLTFAAVMGQAYRIYKNYNHIYPGLADSCIKASIDAWDWAMVNRNLVYDQDSINLRFNPDIKTGEYNDDNFDDELLWAAAELYLATNDSLKYKSRIYLGYFPKKNISWRDVRMLGIFSLLREKPDDISFQSFKASLLGYADDLVSRMKDNAYGVVMGNDILDFDWGSNAIAANQGLLLLYAYRFTSDEAKKGLYLEAAMSNADYLLGRNATGYSFITGFGNKSPKYPHHTVSMNDGITEPVPGLLVGGPNRIAPEKYLGTELAYGDYDRSAHTNEVAINWNAPAVYLFNAIEFEMNKNHYQQSRNSKSAPDTIVKEKIYAENNDSELTRVNFYSLTGQLIFYSNKMIKTENINLVDGIYIVEKLYKNGRIERNKIILRK